MQLNQRKPIDKLPFHSVKLVSSKGCALSAARAVPLSCSALIQRAATTLKCDPTGLAVCLLGETEMKELIQSYEGKVIGVNVIRPNHVEPATIIAAKDDYFTVRPADSTDLHHVPYLNIVKAIENSDGITVKEFLHHAQTYQLVVKIGHLVEYVPS